MQRVKKTGAAVRRKTGRAWSAAMQNKAYITTADDQKFWRKYSRIKLLVFVFGLMFLLVGVGIELSVTHAVLATTLHLEHIVDGTASTNFTGAAEVPFNYYRYSTYITGPLAIGLFPVFSFWVKAKTMDARESSSIYQKAEYKSSASNILWVSFTATSLIAANQLAMMIWAWVKFAMDADHESTEYMFLWSGISFTAGAVGGIMMIAAHIYALVKLNTATRMSQVEKQYANDQVLSPEDGEAWVQARTKTVDDDTKGNAHFLPFTTTINSAPTGGVEYAR